MGMRMGSERRSVTTPMRLVRTYIDYFYVFFGSSFARGIALLNTMIIARLLGKADWGVFSLFYVVMILTWQLPLAFDAVFVTYAKGAKSAAQKNEFLKTAIVLKVFYMALVLVLTYPASYVLACYVFKKPEALLPLVAAMGSGVFLTFLMTVASTLQEQERFGAFSVLNSVYTFSIFLCLSTLWALPITGSLPLIIGLYIVVSVSIGIVSLVLLLKRVGHLHTVDTHVLSESFAQGKWVFGVSGLYYLFTRIDVLFLARSVDLEVLGVYSVAAQLINIVAVATGALAGVALPKAAAAIQDQDSYRRFVRESIGAALLINLGIIALIMLAPWVVQLLFSAKYAAATPILRILLIGWLLHTFFVPFSFLFFATKDSRTRFFLELGKLVVGVGVLYLFVSQWDYGLWGGAWAMTITLGVYAIMGLLILKMQFARYRRKAGLW